MTQDKVVLTVEQALSLYPKNQKSVHVFMNPRGGMLLGTDWGMKEIKELFAKAVQIEIGGEQCKGMGHGLVVWETKTEIRFLECDTEKLNALEPVEAK